MQFDREIKLKIQTASPPPSLEYRETIEISNLRVAFSVLKTDSRSTNTANVRIWNLSGEKRNSLNNYGNEIKLFAGYKRNSSTQLLFTGNNSITSHIFAEPDIITVFDCGDGEKNLNLITASASFGANTPVRTVIEYYANVLKFNIAEFSQTENLTYANGHYYQGRAIDGLEIACDKAGLKCSVQNDSLFIVKINESTSKPPIEINAGNGMLGVPQRYTNKKDNLYTALKPEGEAPKPGWKVRTLLRPDILPNDRINLKSNVLDIEGIFRVVSIRHEGDNYGPTFESLLEVVGV